MEGVDNETVKQFAEAAEEYQGMLEEIEKSIADGVHMDIREIHLDTNNDVFRNAVKFKSSLWTSGRVPYGVSSWFTEAERRVIAAAIVKYHRETCIRYVGICQQGLHATSQDSLWLSCTTMDHFHSMAVANL